ncbi:MAG: hypothetical protein ACOX1F_02780 [Erysipelotrichaceae bacterium]|jgi:hypothetical protein
MKKIIPAVIVTTAAVAAAVTYIKKKFDKQNKVSFIEVEIKPEQSAKKTPEKIADDDILSVSNETLIETADASSDAAEVFAENPINPAEIKEETEKIQETISDAENDDEILEENESEAEDTVEKALLINSIVADIISKEEKFINEAISLEIEKLIDDVVEDEIAEPTMEDIIEEVEKETTDDEASIEELMQEIELQAQQEHIEEVLTSSMSQEEVIQLTPIDLQQSEDETVLKVVDENVGEINLINDIIENLEEEDTVEESIDDLEETVETAVYQEPDKVDDSLLTEEQFLEKCVNSYNNVKENKVKLIIRQVDIMLNSIEVAETISLHHFASFKTDEDRDRYANIASIEGHRVIHSDKDRELVILNTLDTERTSLCKSILQLAQDLAEYNGSYIGWTVV